MSVTATFSVVHTGASVFMEFSLILCNCICICVCMSIGISSTFIPYMICNQSSLMATFHWTYLLSFVESFNQYISPPRSIPEGRNIIIHKVDSLDTRTVCACSNVQANNSVLHKFWRIQHSNWAHLREPAFRSPQQFSYVLRTWMLDFQNRIFWSLCCARSLFYCRKGSLELMIQTAIYLLPNYLWLFLLSIFGWTAHSIKTNTRCIMRWQLHYLDSKTWGATLLRQWTSCHYEMELHQWMTHPCHCWLSTESLMSPLLHTPSLLHC